MRLCAEFFSVLLVCFPLMGKGGVRWQSCLLIILFQYFVLFVVWLRYHRCILSGWVIWVCFFEGKITCKYLLVFKVNKSYMNECRGLRTAPRIDKRKDTGRKTYFFPHSLFFFFFFWKTNILMNEWMVFVLDYKIG